MTLRAAAEQALNALDYAADRVFSEGDDDPIGEARAALRAALAAEQPQPEAPSGWIACNERMPEAGSEVLVWLAAPAFRGDSRIAMDTWGEQHEAPVSWSSATIPVGMGWDSGTDWECITHWMPLPAAPGAAPPPAAPQPAAPELSEAEVEAAWRAIPASHEDSRVSVITKGDVWVMLRAAAAARGK